MDDLSRISSLGCIVCRLQYNVFSEAEIHHLREGTGLGLRDERTIPLCPTHHRSGGHGIAFHAGKKTFEENYGTQIELWEKTNELLTRSNNSISC